MLGAARRRLTVAVLFGVVAAASLAGVREATITDESGSRSGATPAWLPPIRRAKYQPPTISVRQQGST